MREFRACQYGCISLAIAVAEIIIIWGGVALIHGSRFSAPSWAGRLFGFTYFAGLLAR
jgi:hypothetical protein